ncbi:ExbD/TolR family protein [Marinifilum sp. RC60d5]|uniref:ExbD/TolR family protein n=1 Tax=Marinifilum sp. RC60d5 TaxID=3458414 RepID=UPI004036B092
MALKTRNKVNASFSMSSMTDIVFLLLIFFMVTSTLISPNALKLLLPKSSNQTAAKPITTVSIDKNLNFFLETTPVPFSQLENKLQRKLAREEDPTISLHVDKSVPMEQVVKVMNIAKDNKYKLILATRAK